MSRTRNPSARKASENEPNLELRKRNANEWTHFLRTPAGALRDHRKYEPFILRSGKAGHQELEHLGYRPSSKIIAVSPDSLNRIVILKTENMCQRQMLSTGPCGGVAEIYCTVVHESALYLSYIDYMKYY